jgi:cell division protein FtsZ
VLLSIQGGSDLGLFEINEAAQLVASSAAPEANIIFGAVIDDALGDEVRVTVIAAGFDEAGQARTRRPAGAAGRPAPAAGLGEPAADWWQRPAEPAVEGKPAVRTDIPAAGAPSGGAPAGRPVVPAGSTGGSLGSGQDQAATVSATGASAPAGSAAAGSPPAGSAATGSAPAGSAATGSAPATRRGEPAPAGDGGAADAGRDERAAGEADGPGAPAGPGEQDPDRDQARVPWPAGVGALAGARPRPDQSAAARMFDAATTRRRSVVFEEDDELDVPDFLK